MRKQFRRLLSTLAALALTLALLPAAYAADETGSCGTGLTWTYSDSTKILTITGSGKMDDYASEAAQPWVSVRASITGVSLPPGLSHIGNYAFMGCTALTSVTIPSSVATVGDSAFQNCGNLQSATFQGTIHSIGTYAFNQCHNLKTVTFGGNVNDIGMYAFYGCAALESIALPNGLTSISPNTFQGCSSLKSVTLPESMTEIGTTAFSGCSMLENINFPASLKTIGISAFNDCSRLTAVTFPAGLEAIDRFAFQNCDGLTEVTFPAGLKTIGPSAFYDCSNLTEATFPANMTSIEYSAFQQCTKLKTVTFQGSVDAIKESAFSGCAALESVALPEGPTNISSNLFLNCTSLTSVTLPESAIQIGTSTFAGCSALTSIALPANLEIIGANAFSDCSALTSLVIPSSVTTIADQAFQNAAGLASVTFRGETPPSLQNAPFSGVADVTFYYPGGYSAWDPVVGPSYGATKAAWESYNLSDPDPDPVDPDPPVPPEPDPVVPDPPDPVDPDPVVPSPSGSSSGGGGGRRDKIERPPTVTSVERTVQTQEPPAVQISGTGESDMQGMVKDGEYIDWIDRVSLPQYAIDLYTVLTIGGDNDQFYDVLINDVYQTLSPAAGSGGGRAEVESVITLLSEQERPFAGGNVFQESLFSGGYDTIDAAAGDQAIQYAALKEGDIVRTSSYNAIFVTSVPKSGNANFDADLKAACTYASTSFQAFDRDHPEVFWLSGSSKLRMVTANIKEGGKSRQDTFVFFTLADTDGFSVRSPQFIRQDAIEAGIARRDAAVQAILQTLTGQTTHEKISQLNRWLTEHNQYNTSANLNAIPNEPHECLSALTGNIGTDGPVCDGYSRAFKVVCDRLGIPCVLVDGYARASASSGGEFHMWNSVQMPDAQWYGVDVTWNDPVPQTPVGAKSGYENENFLLIGSDTEVLGLKFSVSHPPKNRAADGAVAFSNGPTLSLSAFHPMASLPAGGLPFADISPAASFADAIRYVYGKGLMGGVSASAFAPEATVTRAMAAAVLYRMEGSPASAAPAFRDTAPGAWYEKPVGWAAETGVVSGYTDGRFGPDDPVTWEQFLSMLWRYAASPAVSGTSGSGGTDAYAAAALRWASAEGLLPGTGRIAPQAPVSRAEVAEALMHFCERNAG